MAETTGHERNQQQSSKIAWQIGESARTEYKCRDGVYVTGLRKIFDNLRCADRDSS